MIPNDNFSFYLEGTNGKAVLLAHGLTGIPSEMNYIARHLHKEGYTIYCPLLAGHGVSEAHLAKFKWEDWYQSIADAYDLLSKKYSQIYGAGICFGGTLLLYLQAKKPGAFKGLALYSMMFRYDGWNIPWARTIAKIFSFALPAMIKLPYFYNRSFSENHPYGIKSDRIRNKAVKMGTLAGCLPGFPYPSLVQIYKLSDILKKLLPSITAPILLIHAKEDDVAHINNAKYIVDHIGGECQFHVLNDSYHMIHVDGERLEVAKLTVEFFKHH